ncbi:MAG: NAD(P)-dependent oxidoreductase [Candidatus Nanopelagicales bacterium]
MNQVARLREQVARSYPPVEYPALTAQSIPGALPHLEGRSILDATPCWRNTLPKYLALLDAGAQVTVSAAPGIPHDPDVVALVADLGIPVERGDADTGFDVVLDCAGRHSRHPGSMGVAELTRSGADPYADAAVPVVLVDAGRIKVIEDLLGTSDGFLRAVARLGHDLAGRDLLVFGGGKVGRGISWRAATAGARVSVVDPRPVAVPPGVALLPAGDTVAVRAAIDRADWIVTATGVTGVMSAYADAVVTSSALLANMGATDEYGDDVPGRRVLNDKAPLNFVLPEPTRLRYLESSMALSNAAADWLVARATVGPPAPPGLIVPPDDLEAPILNVTAQSPLLHEELPLLG